MQQETQPITTAGEQRGREAYTLRRWLLIAFIALLNVMILAAFGAYFSGGRLDMLDVIGTVADGIGTVTGLLGIAFFFASERLNRTTAVNLERTTAVVDDLRNQMWGMIRQTFNTFVEKEKGEKVEEAKQALEVVKEQINDQQGEVSPQITEALNTVSSRLEALERERGSADVFRGSYVGHVDIVSPMIEGKVFNPVILVVAKEFSDKNTVPYISLLTFLRQKFSLSSSKAADFINLMIDRRYFTPEAFFIEGVSTINMQTALIPTNKLIGLAELSSNKVSESESQ